MRIVNKHGLHDHHILEHLEAGIKLLGSEVKSLRAGRVDLSQAFVKIVNGEAFLINANIPRYQQTAQKSYDPARTRKLLMHRNQINSLIGKSTGKGVTLVPVAIYVKNNHFKLDVGLGKSKKEFDRRKVIREKDHLRRIEQELRGKE